MANFVYSVGYSLEKIHSGMIVYLCDLWNEGKREPLESFLGYLNVPISGNGALRAAKEHKHVDLVIFDAKDDSPIAAIEMKVDSHEKLVKGEPQTVIYPKLFPETPFLFVTLGAGEYFREPYGEEQVRWIRIRDFHGALGSISTFDALVRDWKATIANEIELQNRCFSEKPGSIDDDYRGRTWNLYFLGHLKQELANSLPGRNVNIEPTVYAHGPGPDTILNFGSSKFPVYLEINSNGLLNLKINLEEQKTREEKEQSLSNARTYYQDLLKRFEPVLNMQGLSARRKTKTVMSFDVGLDSLDGNLWYKQD